MNGFYPLTRDRLVERCPSLLRAEVAMDGEKAVELLALSSEAVSALVSPLSDQASPIRDAGMLTTQNEDWVFGVTMCLVWPGGFDQWETARREIKAALSGWAIDPMRKPVEYAGGQTTQYTIGQDGGRWLHVLRFRAFFSHTYEAQE